MKLEIEVGGGGGVPPPRRGWTKAPLGLVGNLVVVPRLPLASAGLRIENMSNNLFSDEALIQ
jgi:hypothetical protein